MATPRSARRRPPTPEEREREAFGKAADRLEVPPLPPVAPFRMCDRASNGIRRVSVCAFADEKGKCSACVYADRECADEIHLHGWCPVEWEP